MALSTTDKSKAMQSSFPFNNDCMCNLGPLNVQSAFAQSSNTAFTDLAHRVGTDSIISLAKTLGVDTTAYPAGSGLGDMHGEVGLALGTAALTINEQDTMLATIDNGGTYHAAHAVVSITPPNGSPIPTKYAVQQVLTPGEASQVQYAMTTVVRGPNGTAAGMIDQASVRPIIAKTGTTTSNRTAFFIGAIPQYALSIGIFTKDQGDFLDEAHKKPNPETLNNLGGNAQGGFGGYWPAKIWSTFADAEFAKLPVNQFLAPQFTGSTWNQVPKSPPKKKKPTPPKKPCKGFFCPGKNKGGTDPVPVDRHVPHDGLRVPRRLPADVHHWPDHGPTGTSSPTPSSTKSLFGTTAAGTTALVSGGGTPGVQASLAVGGVLSVLPGSLLWTRASRRRRRRRKLED